MGNVIVPPQGRRAEDIADAIVRQERKLQEWNASLSVLEDEGQRGAPYNLLKEEAEKARMELIRLKNVRYVEVTP